MNANAPGTWLRQLAVMTAKELRQLWRDRVLFIYIVYIFTGQILIAGGQIEFDLHNAWLLVRDADRSQASRELVHRFRAPYFRLAGEVEHPDEALALLDQGKVAALLEIPPDFERSLIEARAPATVQLLVDTSKSNIGYLASSYGQRIGAGYGQEWAAANLARHGIAPAALPQVRIEARVWYNPDLRQAWFSTIGDLLSMMTVACLLLPATALVREKEHGTIEQLLVSPLTPFQVMFPKLLAMVLVTLLGTAVSLFAIMQPLFGVPARGSLPLFFALTALYAFTLAGLGLVIATFARNAAQVGLLVFLMVMPIIMLSGTHSPFESMPEWLQWVMSISPLRYFLEIAYGILLRGAGPGVLWDSVLIMAGLGAGLFALGLWRFRRQFM
jgi:ABC-2 type transport system permease protein